MLQVPTLGSLLTGAVILDMACSSETMHLQHGWTQGEDLQRTADAVWRLLVLWSVFTAASGSQSRLTRARLPFKKRQQRAAGSCLGHPGSRPDSWIQQYENAPAAWLDPWQRSAARC